MWNLLAAAGGALLGTGYQDAKNEEARRDADYWNRVKMEREDTAFQRMAKDKKAAGLHPLAGTAAAASGPLNTGQTDKKLDAATQMNAIMSARMAQAQISKTRAETRAIEASIPKKEVFERGWKSVQEKLRNPKVPQILTGTEKKILKEVKKNIKKGIKTPNKKRPWYLKSINPWKKK